MGNVTVDSPPLKLGPIAVDPPVVLAPMAGVTNVAFRRLCRTYGAGLYVSEMVTARALVEGNAKTMGMAAFGDDEPVRSVQLYGVDPVVMHEAVRRLVDDIGVDHIDLNFGCPAAKVTRRGGGAALPVHRTLLRHIIAAAVKGAGSVPVSAKFRIGVDDTHITYLETGRIAEGEGAVAVALHARTAEQLYSGSADWPAIATLKEAVTTIPVLGNGDIWEASDALAMVAATGCDGVVVGRGCLGRPWLFRDLADAFAGRPLSAPPDLGEVARIMAAHAGFLCDTFGDEYGIRQFRKHTSWYLTGFPVGPEVRRAMATIATRHELTRILDGLDAAVPFPTGASRMARGHTNGPRPVHLPAGWLDAVDDPTPPEGAEELVSGG
ncbi:MAG TPA: tRNA dihydrouridine synthase DusB [Acidimicrobiales bacterium]|nr:tRNA dihydrouridine synthase DusB [Acidimicrobiales bacterium]